MVFRGSRAPFVLILTLTFVSTILIASDVNAQAVPVESTKVGVSIFNQTNSYRKSRGLAPLRLNQQLTRAAQLYANHLAETNKTGHDVGSILRDRIAASGYRTCAKGKENPHSAENLHYPKSSVPLTPAALGAEAMAFWRSSPTHHPHLIYSGFRDHGAAAAAWRHNGVIQYKIVQVFGDNCVPSGPIQFPTRR